MRRVGCSGRGRDARHCEVAERRRERRRVHRRGAHEHGHVIRRIRGSQSPPCAGADRGVARAEARVDFHLGKRRNARRMFGRRRQGHGQFRHVHARDRGVGQQFRLRVCGFVASDVTEKRVASEFCGVGFCFGVGGRFFSRFFSRKKLAYVFRKSLVHDRADAGLVAGGRGTRAVSAARSHVRNHLVQLLLKNRKLKRGRDVLRGAVVCPVVV